MPGNLGEPSCIGPIWYSKVTGMVALPLPSCGPAEGLVLDVFQPTSEWAEAAHFQPPPPRG